MQSTCASENLLLRAKRFRQRANYIWLNAKMWIRWASAPCAICINRSLPANSAARRCEKIAPGLLQIERNVHRNFHFHNVPALGRFALRGMLNRKNLFALLDQALCEKKSSRQVQIVAWSPHRHA